MTHFGTVQSFNKATGQGFIHPESGGRDLSFVRSEILWEPMVSPRTGMRLSYRISGENGEASAIDLRMAPALATPSGRKSFSVFRTAAEEVATRSGQDEWDNEGGHMTSTYGHVVSTPDAELPYKVILRHEGKPDTERSFATMHESELFIRERTPRPFGANTTRDQGPRIL